MLLPQQGAALSGGWHELRGWIVPKPGHHFTDVRVWKRDQLFPAVHGYPRPELAKDFPFAKAPRLYGFKVRLHLHTGANPLQFEALDINGEWRSFTSVTVLATAEGAPTESTPAPEALRWHEFSRALDYLLRWQAAEPDHALETLATQTAALFSFRRELLAPPPGFHAHWDEPAALTPALHGRVALGGFIFHETQPLRHLFATTDLLLWQNVETGRERPDVGQHYPQFPHAGTSGVFALIDAPAQLPSPLSVRIYAELADGSIHLCGAPRTRVIPPTESRRPLPVRGTVDFNQARRALEHALLAKGLASPNSPELARAIEQLEQELPAAKTVAPRSSRPTAPGTVSPVPRTITLCTHNLNLEGAPLFLLDLARVLATAGAKLSVLSPADGPLRRRFETLGAAVTISASLGPADFVTAELVIANTFASFRAVHAAKQASKPVLLYVHESVTPTEFYRGHLSANEIARVEEAFVQADCVSFTTAATRDCHRHYGRTDHYRLTPGWIDVAALDHWVAGFPRRECRRFLGLREGELLISNIGTVSDRKGQHVFVRAAELLGREYPELAARTRFFILGRRDTIFDHQLTDLVSHSLQPNIVVIGETPNYLPYFHAADIFVCSSFEESSPRVVLEAMALGTPIIASAVNGVPEQVHDGVEAELVPPGDTAALARGMAKLLLAPEIAHANAIRARVRVDAHFNAATLLPRHIALASAVAAGSS